MIPDFAAITTGSIKTVASRMSSSKRLCLIVDHNKNRITLTTNASGEIVDETMSTIVTLDEGSTNNSPPFS